MPIGILYQEDLKEYDFGEGHPFRGSRYALFYQFLRQHLPEDDNYRIIKAESSTIAKPGMMQATADRYHLLEFACLYQLAG